VEIGSRWFRHACAGRGLDPEITFLRLIDSHTGARVRPPINVEARERAGFGGAELAEIVRRASLPSA
jgi:uncharacterized ferritin-like protein (DUF455 family)